MVDINSTENNMVQIPEQSWYGLVIFDLKPNQMANIFSSQDPPQTDAEAMVELCETGLSYISDRFKEGSHDRTRRTSKPDTDRLQIIADELEEWRKEWLIRSCDFEINAQAIEEYLNDDYIKEDK